MNNFDAILDVGSKNLKLGVFNNENKNIYSAKKIINDTFEKSLNILVRDAEKYLSSHIDDVVVLYDSPKYYSLEISIKKVFDYSTSIKKIYNDLIQEAHFLISRNNFKDQVIHLIINNIIVDENKTLDKITNDFKIKSLVLEIKFICLNKILIENITNKFKNNNLKILNLYCTSYVKAYSFKKQLVSKDYLYFIDIGFERSSGFIFNNNKFESFKSIPIGGNNITKDISKILKLSIEYSEDLKIKFNRSENDISFIKNSTNEINPFSETIEKNISIDLLKQIIVARLDEIIELSILDSASIKNLNSLSKHKLIITGGGSLLLPNNYNLSINKIFSELVSYDENDSLVCETGLDYHKSNESFHIKIREKFKKSGFFENFFNLFSK
ncbi:hypothetical protein IDH13_02990 [Pelagibacterales bacterium SAG-MED34]|nr:hypothetical protein [Pelagibacterales bacterium SAG-MED34]